LVFGFSANGKKQKTSNCKWMNGTNFPSLVHQQQLGDYSLTREERMAATLERRLRKINF